MILLIAIVQWNDNDGEQIEEAGPICSIFSISA